MHFSFVCFSSVTRWASVRLFRAVLCGFVESPGGSVLQELANALVGRPDHITSPQATPFFTPLPQPTRI